MTVDQLLEELNKVPIRQQGALLDVLIRDYSGPDRDAVYNWLQEGIVVNDQSLIFEAEQ